MTGQPHSAEVRETLHPETLEVPSEAHSMIERVTELSSPRSGRLDTALRESLTLSHKQIRKLISTGKVSVSGQVLTRWESEVQEGDLIVITPTAANPSKQIALGATLVYQDDALAVLNKPAGLLSAPQRESDDPSALQAATRLCRGPRRPRVVHRLDKETSGLLVFARTIPAARALQEALANREVKRVYRCLVRGEVNGDGEYLTSVLVRDAGKGKRGSSSGSLRRSSLKRPTPQPPPEPPTVRGGGRAQWAATRYRVISRHRGVSALEVELLTGRTHQIRIHLAEIGHPILGEWVYAPRQKGEPRLALHAASLSLTHPFNGEKMVFEAAWPSDLSEYTTPAMWGRDPAPSSSDKSKKRSPVHASQGHGKHSRSQSKSRRSTEAGRGPRVSHSQSQLKTPKERRDTKGAKRS